MPLITSSVPNLQRQALRISLIILAIALAFSSGLVVSANGRATLISSQEAGPYQIDVSILPAQAVVDNTHMSILLRSRSEDQIVTDATVTVSATGPAGSTDIGPMPAPNDAAPQFFETPLPFDTVGTWQVTINVASHLGEETIVVPMDVREGGGFVNWILLAAVGVVIVTVGIWTWDRVAGRKAAPDNEES